jgi:hypothetical protein
MSEIRTRPFKLGDEVQIWETFKKLESAYRYTRLGSLELMRWNWFRSPGGPIQSWVIENLRADGGWEIVGHHGLCPIRFNFGEQELVCAKTCKTFLLPEFRSKILYIRFEHNCLREADLRFNATYSCAPKTARLRKPLGYINTSYWIHMTRGVQSPEKLSRLMGLLAGRFPDTHWKKTASAIASISSLTKNGPLSLGEYSSDQAAQKPFFKDFWKSSRQFAGMSPRRDIEDLTWRFWQRPDFQYKTLTYTWQGGARAYCVLNITDPLIFYLEDIFIAPPRADLLEAFLTSVFHWCARKGALLLRFSTTTDGQSEELLKVFTRYMQPSPLRHLRPEMDFPRRFSDLGRPCNVGRTSNWNATRFLITV